MGKLTPGDEIPLKPQVTPEPFEKWGMDFPGPIDTPSRQKKYIIMCTDYLINWVETKSIKVATEDKVDEFLRENVFYKFGCPRELVTNQTTQFTSHLIENLLSQHKINHRNSTSYHPHANGQVEVTNRALKNILTKAVRSIRKDWADRPVEATWAYNTTWKTTIGFTPYDLVYGKKALLSIDFEYNNLRMATQWDLDATRAQQERLLQLNGDMDREAVIEAIVYERDPTSSGEKEEEELEEEEEELEEEEEAKTNKTEEEDEGENNSEEEE
eukprot:PITA_35245